MIEDILKQLISLPREDRRKLARTVRQHEEVWNAVHGLGEPSKDLERGVMDGMVMLDNELEPEVMVRAYKVLAIEDPEIVKGEAAAISEREVLASAKMEEVPGNGRGELAVEIATDNMGKYKLELPVGVYDIVFEKLGAVPVTIEKRLIVTGHTDTKNVEMVLEEKA